MKFAEDVGRRLKFAGVVVALFAGGCASMGSGVDGYVPPPLGSSWTNVYRNTGSFGKDTQLDITRGEATWQGRKVVTFKVSNGMTIMAAEEGWLAVVAPDGKPVSSWEPAIGWQYPLYVGKSWATSYRLTVHAANRVVPFDRTCKVEGYGDVPVRAGTFKAFEIACQDTIGNNDRFWFSADMGIFVKTSVSRGPNNPAGPGTQQIELVAQNIRK